MPAGLSKQNTHMKPVTITTDGGCSPNPGPGAWAAVLRCGNHVKEISGYEVETTNNRMEWMAIIGGLRALKKPCKVLIRTDSMVCIYAFRAHLTGKGKKPSKRANVDLVIEALTESNKHEIEVEWVKGHAGDLDNERCDAICSALIVAKGDWPATKA